MAPICNLSLSFIGSNTVAIQTSLTDLSNLQKICQKQDVGIQCAVSSMESTPLSVTTSDSTSQTNVNRFLNLGHPIEANVTQIRIEGQSDSSSIPSSYDPEKTLTQSGLTEFPPLMEKGIGQTFHNRGRRNAFSNIILDDEDDKKYPQYVAISTPSS